MVHNNSQCHCILHFSAKQSLTQTGAHLISSLGRRRALVAFCLKNCCWVVAGQLKIDSSKCGEVDYEKLYSDKSCYPSPRLYYIL